MNLFTKIPPKKNIVQNIFDGPYIFYKGTSVEAYNIEDNIASTIVDTNKPLSVRFSDSPDWDFSFSLKKRLITEPCLYDKTEKIFVLSDIEGEFAAFRRLLVSNNIIDEHYNWTFGTGHLVINGDMFDRGNEVTPLLWLIYKLEEEAKQHGGYVHTITGNHEVMNLSGDWRYVDEKYFQHAHAMNKNYMQLFDENTELGRWLRTKNVTEKIGSLLFVHGGISPLINNLKLSIREINDRSRPYYDKLIDSKDDNLGHLYNRDAPYWYRGYFREPFCSSQDIENTLKLYDCSQIIVGHTIVSESPDLYYEGKVLNTDVNQHKGIHAAVLIEGNNYFVVDDKGNKRLLTEQSGKNKMKQNNIE